MSERKRERKGGTEETACFADSRNSPLSLSPSLSPHTPVMSDERSVARRNASTALSPIWFCLGGGTRPARWGEYILHKAGYSGLFFSPVYLSVAFKHKQPRGGGGGGSSAAESRRLRRKRDGERSEGGLINEAASRCLFYVKPPRCRRPFARSLALARSKYRASPAPLNALDSRPTVRADHISLKCSVLNASAPRR